MPSFARLLLLALLSTLSVGVAPSCATDPQTGEVVVDWPTVATELGLTAQDLDDVAALVSDDDLAEDLRRLAGYLDLAAKAISEHGDGGGGTADLIEKALALADVLVDALPEDDQDDARAALIVARSVLRRIQAYA